jgi:uncharacterized protein (DUF697 family)
MALPFFRRKESTPELHEISVREAGEDVRLAGENANAPGTRAGTEATTPELPPESGEAARPVVEMKPSKPGGLKLCRQKARAMVHKYAAFGTAWAILPVPIATSAGLTALETHMLYWIARAYGEEPNKSDVVMAAGGLELCSVALKTAAVEGANLVPVVGWGVKAAIAGSAIEAIGNAAILHYESKYPNKAA